MPQPTSSARLVITALFVDHQSPAEVSARYAVHRAWVYKLKARYEAEGQTALQPRSRRPKTSPAAVGPEVIDLIVRLRSELQHRHGPATCAEDGSLRCPPTTSPPTSPSAMRPPSTPRRA